MENESVVQANDVEMEGEMVDSNVRSPKDARQESLNGAETNVGDVESTSMAFAKENENEDQEDIEMANAETAGDDVTDIAQNKDNVPFADYSRVVCS